MVDLTAMVESFLPYLAGILIAVVCGHKASRDVVNSMWEYINIMSPGNAKLIRYSGQQEIVGVVERSLYFGALLFNQPLFIGAWITLKTISQSTRWNTDTNGVPGRAIFQPFLVGTGLSLMFAVGGYAITYLWTSTHSYSKNILSIPNTNIFIPLSVIFISFGLLVISRWCLNIARGAVDELKEAIKANSRIDDAQP